VCPYHQHTSTPGEIAADLRSSFNEFDAIGQRTIEQPADQIRNGSLVAPVSRAGPLNFECGQCGQQVNGTGILDLADVAGFTDQFVTDPESDGLDSLSFAAEPTLLLPGGAGDGKKYPGAIEEGNRNTEQVGGRPRESWQPPSGDHRASQQLDTLASGRLPCGRLGPRHGFLRRRAQSVDHGKMPEMSFEKKT
jgi:hypothetical protein